MTAPRKRAPAKKTAAAAQSQRERLMGRPRPSLPYRLLVDPAGAEAARERLATVQSDARQTRLREKQETKAYKDAQRRVSDAEAAVEACYETVILRALPPARVEELADEHPPTDEQIAKVKAERDRAKQRGEEMPDWPSWNEDTYWPALLAECAENGMTVEDWTTFLGEHASAGEVAGLRSTALAVNLQERASDPLVLPKGWTPTRS